MSEEKPFGFDVVYEERVSIMMTEQRSFHCKGSAATARRRALFKTGYAGLVSLTPLTEEQYIRAFGVPGMRM
jgi:hypothetical protein